MRTGDWVHWLLCIVYMSSIVEMYAIVCAGWQQRDTQKCYCFCDYCLKKTFVLHKMSWKCVVSKSTRSYLDLYTHFQMHIEHIEYAFSGSGTCALHCSPSCLCRTFCVYLHRVVVLVCLCIHAYLYIFIYSTSASWTSPFSTVMPCACGVQTRMCLYSHNIIKQML